VASYVAVASISVYFVLKMFPETLPRPPRFCLVDQTMILAYNGASAAVIALMVLLTLPLWRRHRRIGPAAELATVGFRSAAALLPVGLVMEVGQGLLIGTAAYRPLQALGQVCDVLALAAAAGAVLATVPMRTLLLDPRWGWRLALIAAALPGLLITIGKPGYSEQVYLWLRIGVFPAAFALFWDASLGQQEPTDDSGMRNLVGVIFFVAAAVFLHLAMLLASTKSGMIQGANIVALVVVGANSVALLLVGLWRLWRDAGHRLDRLGSATALLFLLSATFPRYDPPWIEKSFGLLLRLTVVTSQAMAGLALLAGLRLLRWLGRNDPAGGAPALLGPLWIGLGAAFLVGEAVHDWIWTYEIWVERAQRVGEVVFRQRIVYSFALLAGASLLALVPSVRRSMTRALRARKEEA